MTILDILPMSLFMENGEQPAREQENKILRANYNCLPTHRQPPSKLWEFPRTVQLPVWDPSDLGIFMVLKRNEL